MLNTATLQQLGRDLPAVIVSKVQLGYGGTSELSDPHVSTDLENWQGTNVFGNKEAVGTPDVDGLKNDGRGLTAELRLTVRDLLPTLGGPEWSKEEIIKYTKVRVEQVTNPETLAVVTSGKGVYTAENVKEFGLLSFIGTTPSVCHPYSCWSKTLEFKVNSAAPDFLGYVVYTYLDVKDLEAKYSIDLSAVQIYNSRVLLEKVIENGARVKSSFYFKNQESVWGGLVHLVDGEVRGGLPTDATTPALIQKTGLNTKLVDYRLFDDLYAGILARDFPTPPRHLAVQTQLETTIDDTGAVRAFFGIHPVNFLVANSRFGSFLLSLTLAQQNTILQAGALSHLRFVRRRVNEAGEPFSDSEVETLIAEAGETKYGQLTVTPVTVDADEDGEFETVIGTITEENLLPDYRHFVVSDMDIRAKFVGKYQYGLEIIFRDSVAAYIQQNLNRLSAAIAALVKYRAAVASKELSGTRAVDFYNAQTAGVAPEKYIWIVLSWHVEHFLGLFSENAGEAGLEILKQLNPLNVTLQFVEHLIKVLSSVDNSLRVKFGMARQAAEKSYASPNNSATTNILRALHWFGNIVDLAEKSGSAYKFIEVDSTGGSFEVAVEGLVNRSAEEASKYFTETDGRVDLKTEEKDYGSFDIKAESLKHWSPSTLISTTPDAGQENLELSGATRSSQSLKRTKDTLLKEEGFSGVETTKELQPDQPRVEAVDQPLDASESIPSPENQPGYTEQPPAKSPSEEEITRYLKTEASKATAPADTLAQFDLKQGDNVLAKAETEVEARQLLDRMPLQVKQLLAGSLDQGVVKNNLSSEGKSLPLEMEPVYDFGYRTTQKIEQLLNYKDGQAVWGPVDLEKPGDSLVRLRPVGGSALGLSPPSILDLPTVNKIFVLRNQDRFIPQPIIAGNNLFGLDRVITDESAIHPDYVYTSAPRINSIEYFEGLITVETICNFVVTDGIVSQDGPREPSEPNVLETPDVSFTVDDPVTLEDVVDAGPARPDFNVANTPELVPELMPEPGSESTTDDEVSIEAVGVDPPTSAVFTLPTGPELIEKIQAGGVLTAFEEQILSDYLAEAFSGAF